MAKFSTYIKIIHPASRGLHFLLLSLYDHLYLLQQLEPHAQQGTSPHIRSRYRSHTMSAFLWKKQISLFSSLQPQVQMFGQLSCSISNDHLDLTVLAEKRQSDPPLWRDCVISGQKIFVYIFSTFRIWSPLPEGSTTIKSGLPSGWYPEAFRATCTWVVRARTAVCPPQMWLCPVVL